MHRHFRRLAAALADYEQTIRLAPKRPMACYWRARPLMDMGRREEAERAWQQALRRARDPVHRQVP